MGDRVSQSEIEKAADVHVIDYALSKGEQLIKQGSKYYYHAVHDSLKFNVDGRWYWNSRGVGGYGAISFARIFYGLSFQDAVTDVLELNITKSIEKSVEENKEFEYPKHHEVNHINNAKNYLVNKRMIDEKIVLALYKHDLIAEDKLKNCIFKWKDAEGNLIGAERQGTVKMENKRGSFKQIMAFSKSDGGFYFDVGTPNKIAFFESPIDALSYFDLKRIQNTRYQSMSGLKPQTFITALRQIALECSERGEELEQVIIAVDNDKAGKEFIDRWKSWIDAFDKVIVDVPTNKDWNLDLVQLRLNEKNQNKVIER